MKRLFSILLMVLVVVFFEGCSSLHNGVLEGSMTVGGHLLEFVTGELEIGYDIKTAYSFILPETEDLIEAGFRDEAVNY